MLRQLYDTSVRTILLRIKNDDGSLSSSKSQSKNFYLSLFHQSNIHCTHLLHYVTSFSPRMIIFHTIILPSYTTMCKDTRLILNIFSLRSSASAKKLKAYSYFTHNGIVCKYVYRTLMTFKLRNSTRSIKVSI